VHGHPLISHLVLILNHISP